MVTHEEDVASHAKRIIHVIDGLISEDFTHRTTAH